MVNKVGWHSISVLGFLCILIVSASAAAEINPIVSDDFSAPALNTSLWTKMDPLGDSTFDIIGTGTKNALLSISVNDSIQHEYLNGNYNAPRIMQNVSNTDFELEVKFQSQMTTLNQMEGVIIQQDTNKSIRFTFEKDWILTDITNIYAVTFDNESNEVIPYPKTSIIGSPASLYMRVKRVGDQWTMNYSSDGINWNTGATFPYALTVTSVGPFAGQTGLPYYPPAYTLLIDYFFNTYSPIVPEDLSKFNISGHKINASDGTGIANWNITLINTTIDLSTFTDANGFYEFTDLYEGTYTVSEEVKRGWLNLTNLSQEITGTDQDIIVDFTNQPVIPTYTVSGRKINESDNSGVPGWNITITNGTITKSTLTNGTGFYEFTNIRNGTYTVSEELRSLDWTNVTPSSLDIEILGQDELVNFRNHPKIRTYTVSGWKINGSDGSGLPGWNITITNGTLTTSVFTDDTGFYNFTDMRNGTYTVSEELQTDWKSISPVSREITIFGHDISDVNFTNVPVYILSDDFSDPTLNLSIWTIINPKNDTNFTMVGTGTRNALLSIAVPNTSHDIWTGINDAPRIMQNASNKDFEIEVKFESQMTSAYQIQGVIIQQDSEKFIRFDFENIGSNTTRIFAATFANGIGTAKTGAIKIGGSPSDVPLYMRVKRVGDTWTMKYSMDNITWTQGFNFPYTLNVTSVGPFVGNSGTPAPAYTGLIDYFFNTNSPAVPEDESKYSISGWKINGSDNKGIPGWNITVKKGAIQTSTLTNDTGFYEFPYLLNGTYTVSEKLEPEWVNVTPLSREINIDGQAVSDINFINKPLVIVSDDFSAQALKTPLWTKIDPLNDSTISIVGTGTKNALLSISVPGTLHEYKNGNYNAPRIMQNASNRNFEIEVKFQSQMTLVNQMEGVIIQQDSNKSIRFTFERDYLNTNLFAVTFDNESYGVTPITSISGSPASLYMRVKRVGDQWTMKYSQDGTNWTTGETFPYLLTVTSAGPFVGNSGYFPPAYTGLIDYFFNTESPVIPEDLSKFRLSGFKLNGSDNTGIANWNITIMNSTMDRTTFTNTSGFYEFADLIEGAYTVSEELRSGWTNITTISRNINGIDQDIREDFVNQPSINTYNLSGFKINESDGRGISGWNITLNNSWMETTRSTDGTGFYEFRNLVNGTYKVFEELRPGWKNVTPVSREITIIGQDVRVNFSNRPIIPAYNISGWKINGSNNAGLSGWNITIKNSTMQISKLTDQNGYYNFSNLLNGTYNVSEEQRPEWGNVSPASREITISGSDRQDVNFTNIPLVIVSDDFSAPAINTSIWTIINPKNDSNLIITGNGTKNALLSITVPGTSEHDIWTGIDAPRLMQKASNRDFEIEVKFQSAMDSKKQIQGVLVQQDSTKFIRFDFESDGINTKIFAATFNNGIGTGIPFIVIGSSPSTIPMYMRVKRVGDQWTMKYSLDGMNWTTGFDFSYQLNVTSIGPFVGNADFPTPAHTGLIDYFFNTESLIVPEDAPPAGTKFNLSGYKINASDGTGVRNWNITITDGTNTTSTLTDANGRYNFTNLIKGTYTVTEKMQPGWMNITPVSLTIAVNYEDVTGVNFTNIPLVIGSDDFSAPTLNTSMWTMIDPVNESTFTIEGTRTSNATLNITIPEGKSHDPFLAATGNNNASRVMQSVRDTDFEVEAKFQSVINTSIQIQGILVEQDKTNFIRFEFYTANNKIYIYKADIINGFSRTSNSSIIITNTSDSPIPLYMRIKRAGNQWTQNYSFDGITWTTAVNYTRAYPVNTPAPLTVTAVGPYIGTAGTFPAFTGQIDYFFNADAPVVPEDPLKFNLWGFKINASDGSGIPGWNITLTKGASQTITSTNETGFYRFADLTEGNYTVSEEIRSGWMNVTPISRNIDGTSQDIREDFRNQPIIPTYNISGFKINADTGIGIAGWNITIKMGSIETSTLTDVNGSYHFSNIPNGTYQVTEKMKPGWMNTTDASREILVNGNDTSDVNFTNKPLSIVSDDFSAPALNTSLWTIIDPRKDSNYTIEGTGTIDALLNITIPGGISHDPFFGGDNNAARIVQSVRDTDFEVEAKFQSIINTSIQMQGILVEQDRTNFIRFEFYTSNNKISIYKADIINGSSRNSNTSVIINGTSDSPVPLYMRVKRAGNHWTQSYSLDGINWTIANNYTRIYPVNTPAPLIVTAVGPYIGTAGTTPAFTGLIDYFFNRDAPVVTEDPVKLNISGFNIDDNNSNGMWDAGETGLSGWKVSLHNVDTDVEIKNTTTDLSGHYAFIDLLPGSYKVKEETKPDYIATNSTSVIILLSSKDISNLNFTNYLPRIPPSITTQPVDQILKLGKTASFIVVANGSQNLTYQWQRNGINITSPSGKNQNYSIFATRMVDNGATFRVIVSNPYGFIISNSSKLTVKNIVSDDFNAMAINTSIWTKSDPIGDAKFTMIGTGTQDAMLNITLPAGVSHDVWRPSGVLTGGNNASRLMQTADNSNFEIQTKFQSQITAAYQMQGIIIQQDTDNYLRFDFTKYPASLNVYSAIFANGSAPEVKINTGITPGNSSLYMRINRTGDNWKQFYSNDSTNWTLAANFNHTMIVSMVGPFVGNSGSPAPAFTGLVDYFFNTSSPAVPEDEIDVKSPNITIWYGNSQRFGHIDRPQRWVNILGNVNDPSGVATLNYSLNNGIASNLSIGPDGLRLQSPGDFNVELNYSSLQCGNNQLVIRAADTLGNSKNETVSINYSCNNVLPKNYNINWSNVTSIQDVAQITDGLWIKEANSIRPSIIGYDRMITIGNMTWDDYEIIAPITLNTVLDYTAKPGGPNFGFGMRWSGHYDSVPAKQPRSVWNPLGALGVYIWNQTSRDFELSLIGNNMQVLDYDKSGTHLAVGTTYIFKMRAETIVSNTLYSLKVWEQGTPEPLGWTVSGYGPASELKRGSLTVTSHYGDVSIGNISIRPGPFPTVPPVISNVSVDALTNSATVKWITNVVTTSNLSYGLTTAYGNGTTFDGNKLLVHSVTLNNLTQGTLYHYKINATNSIGNSTNTSDLNFTTMKVTSVTSEDFHAPVLNNTIWTEIDPKGDATITLEGNDTVNALLNITIPAGTSHDIWRTNGTGGIEAPRLIQFVSNDDFEIQTKFQSQITTAYQMQGIIIEQDNDNYLRFDYVMHPSTLKVYAARFTAGSTPVSYSVDITPDTSILYMRVNRTGNNWKQSYSLDGTNWIPAANFTHTLAVTSVGLFAGNAGVPATASPAFTVLADYFFNTKSPIVPEDPVSPKPPTITVQPVNKTAFNGSGTTFNVLAAGSEPLSYQWKKDGVNITNATGPSYTTPAVTFSDIGTKFSVLVWNVYGNVTSNEVTLSVIEKIEISWWNTTYNFRVPITVNAASFERYEKPVELSLDFTRMLSELGTTGTFDKSSIRVIETNSLGEISNEEVQFQFDEDTGFNAATKASGTIVFIMNGTTQAAQNRYYQVYFGLTGSYSPLTVTPKVTLTDNIMDEEQSSYQIGAAGSTYYFQKQAGGFSSLVDASGNDWINFHPTPANSAGGSFRGIPNVYEGGIFHPGHKNATSRIVSQGPLKIRVQANSTNGKWISLWDFYPGYATMTMVKAGANYWWLYEGTPGGVMEPNKDFTVRSDNKKALLSETVTEDIPTQEWQYFSDPTVNRSLFVSHHEDDTLMDISKQMNNLMTVFGFGRDTTLIGALSGTQRFTMGLMDGTEFAESSKTIYSAYKDLKITTGVVEQYDNANPPTVITHPVDRYVLIGTPVTFNVSVVGQMPMSYQWKQNGTNISGATSASYTIPSANMADNGSLVTITITNTIGSVTSNPAKLTVGTQVVLLDVDYTHTGKLNVGPRAFSFFDIPAGVPSNLVSPINYANGTLFQRVEVINKPSTKGVVYKLCIFQDEIIPERHSCAQSSGLLKFSTPGSYTSNMLMRSLYQYNNNNWSRNLLRTMLVVNDVNGVPVDDRYGWLGNWSGSPDFSLYYPMKVQYTAIIVPPGGIPVWTLPNPPAITTQPANKTFMLGQTTTFSVAATGTAPLYYQWQRNGVNISGAYSSSYTTPSMTLDDNGSTYRVIVTNEIGSVTSNDAQLTVSTVTPPPPSILQNPGFESGTTSWTFYTSTAGPTFTAVPPGYEGDNAAKLVFSKVGTNMQLYQSGIPLEPKTRYRLSFAGKSTLGHDVKVRLIRQTSTYPNYGLDYIADFDTNWSVITTEFNTTGFTTNVTNGRLQFYFIPFAKAGDTYNIDNVILEKVVAGPAVPPEVVGNAPTGTDVPATASISVNFSKPMDHASVQSAFSTSPAINGSFSWSGNNMIYTPVNLSYNTTYNVTVGTGARDSAGINMLLAYNWSFTIVQDTTNPTIIGNTPTGTNEPLITKITVTFSEAMNPASVQSAFSTSPATTGSFSWSGNVMTYTPGSKLNSSRTYNVTVGTAATDLAGNNMSVPFDWNFITMDEDLIPPTVIGKSPDGTDVSLAARIMVNFSEPMDQASVQSAFSTSPSTNGSFSWSGNNMTYTPVLLSYNTTYNVTVGTGAMDSAGNNMSPAYSWPFTTVKDTTNPEVIGKTPTGTNEPVTTKITVTFSEAMNPASVQSAFSTSPATTGSFSWSGTAMTYTPGSNLNSSTTYSVTIGSDAMDLAGNNMLMHTWQFTTASQSGPNLVQNPGFESGKTSWTFYTDVTGPTFTAVTPGYEGIYSAKLAFSKAGTNMQLYQSGIPLEPNTRYRLSFAGKSTLGHDVKVRLIRQTSTYPSYGLDYIADLDTNWSVLTTEFNTTGFTTNVTNGRLQFYFIPFAKAGDTYNIDNIVLEKATAAPPVPPEVVGNAPTGTNVPVTASISVNFSKPMDHASVQSAFSTTPAISGSFSWSGNNMIYTPVNLSYNTTYNVTVGTGAVDSAGINMLLAYNWSFTTARDTASPTVIGKTPIGINEPITTKITVTFSEAMDNSSVQSAFSTSPGTNGSFSWSGNVMTYTPDSNLAYNQTYIVTVGTGAKDIAGNSLNSAYSWPFITLTLDTAPPTVSGNTPTGANEPVTTRITVTFSEAMNTSSAQSAFSTFPDTTGSFSWSGNTMNYTPDSILAYSTTYNVTVGTGAMDLAGNNMSVPYEWNFTTTAPDQTHPTVISNSPTGSNVPVTAKIIVNFSEEMNHSSVESSFFTINGTSGSFTWSGNNMTYTPGSNLEYGKTYTVIIGTGAKDIAGNNMDNVSNWQFNTVQDTTPPGIIGNSPTGPNIPINSQITVTFNKSMNTTSVGSAFSTSPATNGSFSWSGNVMTYTPDANLSIGTSYNVTIGSGAMDLAGNNLLSYSWQFTTENMAVDNLIKNPGFESGKTSWTFYTNVAGPTFSAVTPGYEGNYSAKLAFSKVGTNMQLYQSAITLEPNSQYRLSFTGKSTMGHDIKVRLIKQASPYTNYGLDYIADLDTNWGVITTEFNTTGFTTKVIDARLQFYLVPFAQAGDTYNLDNVVLEKIG